MRGGCGRSRGRTQARAVLLTGSPRSRVPVVLQVLVSLKTSRALSVNFDFTKLLCVGFQCVQ